MNAAIRAIQDELDAVNYNIRHYTKLPEIRITPEDRKKTLSDLNELKKEFEDAIKHLQNQ